jgi:hypothetical protein
MAVYIKTLPGMIKMSTLQKPAVGEACIPNISSRERRKRLISGVVTLVITLTILWILMSIGASRWWRIALLPLFMGAAIGFFQWRDKTCVALAARGTYNLNDREEKMEDQAVLAQVRQQARRVQFKALLTAIPLTLIVLALPILL